MAVHAGLLSLPLSPVSTVCSIAVLSLTSGPRRTVQTGLGAPLAFVLPRALLTDVEMDSVCV